LQQLKVHFKNEQKLAKNRKNVRFFSKNSLFFSKNQSAAADLG